MPTESFIFPPSGMRPLAAAAQWAGALVAAQGRPGAWQLLRQSLAALLPYRNFIVFDYRDGRAPALLDSSFERDYLLRHLHDYLLGLYQLDPFHAFADGASSGLYRMADIAPEGFRQSEYYLRHYQATQVTDELRFAVPLAPGRSVHVLVEREFPASGYTARDLRRLQDVNPFIQAFIVQHMRALDLQGAQETQGGPDGGAAAPVVPRAAFDLRDTILRILPGEITARECDIIELMLKGHSVKSMASQLAIEEATVTNHKRNIYAKMHIHSQAQLFDRFLRVLGA